MSVRRGRRVPFIAEFVDIHSPLEVANHVIDVAQESGPGFRIFIHPARAILIIVVHLAVARFAPVHLARWVVIAPVAHRPIQVHDHVDSVTHAFGDRFVGAE